MNRLYINISAINIKATEDFAYIIANYCSHKTNNIDNFKLKFDLCNEYQFNKMFKYFTGLYYKKTNPNFTFKENTYTSSYIINSVILPNKNNPMKILKILENNNNIV